MANRFLSGRQQQKKQFFLQSLSRSLTCRLVPLNSYSAVSHEEEEKQELIFSTPNATSGGGDDQFLNLNDVGALFSTVSTHKLLRSALNLHASAIGPIVDAGTWVMNSRLLEIPVLREATLAAVKHTVFRHFCAGETPEEAGNTAAKLWEESGIRGMLVYGPEHATDNEFCDRNLQGFLQTVESAKSVVPRSSVSFVVVKMTAICPMELLRRVSDHLRWQHRDLRSSVVQQQHKLPWKRETMIPIFADGSPLYHTQKAPHPLTREEEQDLELAHQRLQKLYQSCCEANVPLMVDAEDTIVQPSIDYMTYSCAAAAAADGGFGGKKNMDDDDEVPPKSNYLFNTIQTYLKDSRERLVIAQGAAEKMGLEIGFKLVRGAYMWSEGKLASQLGVESPIHNSMEQTHACFNDCTSFMLQKIAGGGSRGPAAVVIASHNLESGVVAARKSRELGINREDKRVQFAQLYGMADGLSLSLRNAGFQVSKYMPFGPVDMVMLYLLRRAEENRGLLSASSLDRHLIRKELKRRLGTLFSSSSSE